MHVNLLNPYLDPAHTTRLSQSCMLMPPVPGCSVTPVRHGSSTGFCSLPPTESVSGSESGSDSVPSYSDSLAPTAAHKPSSEIPELSHHRAALGSGDAPHCRQPIDTPQQRWNPASCAQGCMASMLGLVTAQVAGPSHAPIPCLWSPKALIAWQTLYAR